MNNPPTPPPKLIGTAQAAKIISCSQDRVIELCQRGEFKSAVRPTGPTGNWKVDAAEVRQRIMPQKK